MSTEKPIHFCAVNGFPAFRRLCLSARVGTDDQGRRQCGHDGPCEHKKPADEPNKEQP